MATFKRKRFSKRPFKPNSKKRVLKKKSKFSKAMMQQLAKRLVTIERTVETKSGSKLYNDGNELSHNSIAVVDSNLLFTTQGVGDPMNATGNRIGDNITLRNLQIKGFLELNERYSDVTMKIIVVKSAKGDVPNGDNLFQGNSANKMLDSFNTERFSILAVKQVKLNAPNMSIVPSGIQTVGSGFTAGVNTQQSRATRIFSINIPGKKFGRNGVIQYENGTTQVKFFDYHLIIFAYSNWSTSATLGFNVARVNDMYTRLFFKDA